jgi:hypothetical protein
LILQCHKYNNTHVHRGFSFENALLDAILLLQENAGSNVLVGGVDEITAISHRILQRFGLYKNPSTGGRNNDPASGTGAMAGEGAGFFLLTNQESKNNLARLDGISTFYKPSGIEEIEKNILGFMEMQSMKTEDIDLVIAGSNGDPSLDQIYEELNGSAFSGIARIPYKWLCGEYPTSAAFALWLATRFFGDDEFPFRRREVPIGDVNRDSLLALGDEPVGQQRQVKRRAAALRRALDRRELVGEDRLGVVEQAADQRALAVVDRTGG